MLDPAIFVTFYLVIDQDRMGQSVTLHLKLYKTGRDPIIFI
jgi:hypothetical protein